MSRGINASVITELQKSSFNMAHLVSIDFDTIVFLTDYSHDIIYSGDTYTSSSHLIGMSTVNETSKVQTSSYTLNLSSVNKAFLSILLGQDHIDREVNIYRAILDSNGGIIGEPIPMYSGRIDGFQVKEDDDSSEINLSIASHWSDFERQSGRRTNQNSQQVHFPTDLGFQFASSTVKDIKWGRA